jgi:hypothetical protein
MRSTVDFWRNSISGRSQRPLYRTAALIWATALLIGSLQPRRPANFHFSVAHHVAHFLGFGALAFLATVGFGNPIRNSLWPAAASFLFGFVIEFLQHVQNRMPIEWYDVLDDAVGALAFAAFCRIVYCRAADATKGPLRINEFVPK